MEAHYARNRGDILIRAAFVCVPREIRMWATGGSTLPGRSDQRPFRRSRLGRANIVGRKRHKVYAHSVTYGGVLA